MSKTKKLPKTTEKFFSGFVNEYKKYGQVNNTGFVPGNEDSVVLHVSFDKLNNGLSLNDLPKEFEGYQVKCTVGDKMISF